MIFIFFPPLLTLPHTLRESFRKIHGGAGSIREDAAGSVSRGGAGASRRSCLPASGELWSRNSEVDSGEQSRDFIHH